MALAIRTVLFFACFVAIVSYGNRPLSKEVYETIVALIKGEFCVPVKERTLQQKAAIVRYYRDRDRFEIIDGRLHFDKRLVVKVHNLASIVDKALEETKGGGSRKLMNHLSGAYVGISEGRIASQLNKSEKYQQIRRKFVNKPFLQPIKAKGLHERHQIDLMDMHPRELYKGGKKIRYIMTIIDVFSRYLWARSLHSKSSLEIANHLRSIYSEVGPPRIIQHDRGLEFEGAVKRLMVKMNVKIIRSSPYHPQSQGKVERSHRTLRQKVHYDLVVHKDCVNWVDDLWRYVQIINDEKRECLGYRSAFEIFYGRKNNLKNYILGKRNPSSVRTETRKVAEKEGPRKPLLRKLRKRRQNDRADVRKASQRCRDRMVKAGLKRNPPSVYNVGDRILVRTHNPRKRPRMENVREGRVVRRSENLARYKIRYDADGNSMSSWFSVKNLTSTTMAEEKRRPKLESRRNILKSIYYIANVGNDWLHRHGFQVKLDPSKDGDCQFAAIADQLRTIGIDRSAETLRREVVRDIQSRPTTMDGTPLENFVNDVQEYIQSMSIAGTYGDHITLQRVAELFNVQFVVFSAIGPQGTVLISPSGFYDPELPTLYLGHGGEGINEHYVSVYGDWNSQQLVISTFAEIPNVEPVVGNGDSPSSIQEDISPIAPSVKGSFIDPCDESFNIMDLPNEMLTLVVDKVLDDDLGMAEILRTVHPSLGTIADNYIGRYPDRVRRYNRLVYINGQLVSTLNPTGNGSIITSVQRLSRKSGRHSGLMQEIQNLLNEYKRWWTAWLILLPVVGPPGWFRIDNVYWRR